MDVSKGRVVVASPVSSRVASARGWRLAAWARGAWGPAVVVFVGVGALLGAYLALGGDVRDFLHIGRQFLAKGGDASAVIRYDPSYHGYPADGIGYDGQFYYFFAIDPAHAAAYMDEPAYRLSRPLYPMLARALALGQPWLVPWVMLLINWLAIGGTALALGDVLRRRRLSPWLTLIYVAFPGTLAALHADVTEPLAYALVALGLWLWERGERRVWLWPGVAFALAILTRETAAAFPLALALGAAISGGLAARGRGARIRGHEWSAYGVIEAAWRPALWLAGVMAPYLAWKGFVLVWMGSEGVPSELVPTLVPFQGLAALWPWAPSLWASALFVGIPGALLLGLAVWGLWRRPAAPELWALALQSLFFCVLLRAASWYMISAFRLSTGSLLALLWAAPLLVGLAKRSRLWMALIFALWVCLAPVALAGFFPSLAGALGAR
ncbi:MAG TPA: hypothetical protein VFQ25_11795 [Ktedonobacterales bacterium]|nr:hypothetical protein [Ktedonobacterales bacterium]